MKLLLLSDIHANWPALQAVLAAEPLVDGVVCLGDLVNYGPHPVECVDWARTNAMKDWVVQGNHDYAFAHNADPRCSPRYRVLADAMQRSTSGLLDDGQKEYLAKLPMCAARQTSDAFFVLCHALPTDPLYAYLRPEDDEGRWLSEIAAVGYPDFLLLGHTHVPFIRHFSRTTVVNPGSVGQPKDGDPRASYSIWDDGKVFFRRAAYDVNATARALAACAPLGVSLQLTEILLTGGKAVAEAAP
jgi:putative phosphoesterase